MPNQVEPKHRIGCGHGERASVTYAGEELLVKKAIPPKHAGNIRLPELDEHPRFTKALKNLGKAALASVRNIGDGHSH